MTRESVTDVMRKAADFLPAQLAGEMTNAADLVAELMASDAEYDAARFSLNNPAPVVRGWFADLKYQDNMLRFNIAVARRAAAIARCKAMEQTDEH